MSDAQPPAPADSTTEAAHPPDTGTERSQAEAARELNGVIRWCAAVLLSAAVAALVLAVAYALRVVVIPALVALLITALVTPVHHLLLRVGLPPWLAAGLAATVVVAVVGVAVWGVVLLITESAQDFADAISGVMQDAAREDGPLGDALNRGADSLSSLGSSAASAAAGGVVSGLHIVVQVLGGAVLTMALVFFFLRDRHRMAGLVRSAAPRGHADLVNRIARRTWYALAGFMRGTTIIATVDAVLIGVGLAILGVPQPAGLAALVFVGAYIPFVGAFLSGAVAVLVALADGGMGIALAALGLILLVQFIEGTVLAPVVHSRTVSLHPALVLVALAAGASLGGLVGTLLAVPLTSALVGGFTELRSAVRLPGSQAPPPDRDQDGAGPAPEPADESGDGGPPRGGG